MLSNPWFQNITSNLLTVMILVVLAWLVHVVTRRNRLLALFGIKDNKRLVLYLSNVNVLGSSGVDGRTRSFREPAIPVTEVALIQLYQRLFNVIVPALSDQPGLLKWLLVSDVTVDVQAAPPHTLAVENTASLVAVGSPAYNSASLKVEQSFHPLAKFNSEYSSFSLDPAHPTSDLRCGFVQRAHDPISGQIAFYVAGMSSLATAGAAYFLTNRWLDLAKKYKSMKPFCVVLRISEDDYRVHEILFEKG
ncbi:MAG: hypothetical protein ABUS47_00360 [Steroidobacter sp.]